MQYKLQYSLKAYREAQAFLNERDAQVGILNKSEGRQLLDEGVAQMETQAVVQAKNQFEIDGNATLVKSLETALRKTYMDPLANYARARLAGVPNYATLARSSFDLKGAELVQAARAMAAAARPFADAFVRGGFAADAIDRLEQSASALQQQLDAGAVLTRHRKEATSALRAAAARATEGVKMLSATIDQQFAQDSQFLAAWRSVKRVTVKPGVPRQPAKPDTPSTVTVPAPVPEATK